MSRMLTVLLGCCLLVGAAGARAELHRLGFVREDLSKVAPEHEVKSIPPALGAKSFLDLPVVDLTSEMPPVGNQGGQGSCASWSIAYYHRTQLEYHERHWDLNDPHHQFSPAFCYNQVNGGGDNGSGFGNNMPLICESGVASLADCPYNDGDPVSWPSESAYSKATPYRTKDWAWFHTDDTTGVNMIKQLLANGSTSCLSIGVWGNFDNIAAHNYMYCSADREGENRGGHLITFVGYNDTLTTVDGTGAFRMVNSWGPGWGQAGYFWMSYEAVMDSFLCPGREVAYLTDTVGYVPRLLARANIDHPTRDRFGLQFSVGKRWSALWLYNFRSWARARTDQPFPDNKIVFDLTDAASFIESKQTDSIYFVATDGRRDSKTGSVLSSSVQLLDWGTLFYAESCPRSIPDNGNAVPFGHRLVQLDNNVSTTVILAPRGILEPDSSYVPTAEVRNFGTATASFPAMVSIGAGYADTVQVNSLAPASAETLEFAPWVVPARCTAVVRCSTALSNDEYHGDDVATSLVWARYHDAGLVDILVPADTVDSGRIIYPSVRIRNNGTQAEYVTATFRIPDAGYLRQSRVTVPSNGEMSVTFATWVPKELGSHVLRCSLNFAGDADPVNDTMGGTTFVVPVGIAEGKQTPPPFRLDVPRPSVFDRSVAIAFALPKAADVSLSLYDAAGKLVRQLRNGTAAAGDHRLTWDGRDGQGRAVPSGAYFCRLDAGDRRATAVLLKL
ncbi:hypothetical protein FJY68_01610 [candidate division WOR-3 bacterium]|uniref:T9SS type A sorting domain-containing protein n=1 Tax=candidate division WOR-3 bacterium TaxID=2052148 RepID=A0A937XF52_UNCW3|nr:hypothetical protein [candidate division WOR-3 bacterium]